MDESAPVICRSTEWLYVSPSREADPISILLEQSIQTHLFAPLIHLSLKIPLHKLMWTSQKMEHRGDLNLVQRFTLDDGIYAIQPK